MARVDLKTCQNSVVIGSLWTEMEQGEYDAVWERFYREFSFRPNYHERVVPAIVEPSPSMTFDLEVDWSDEFLGCLKATFRQAFQSTVLSGDRMYFLDWQHQCYRYEPHADDTGSLPVLPDGDYYISLSRDFSRGTFGHPCNSRSPRSEKRSCPPLRTDPNCQ